LSPRLHLGVLPSSDGGPLGRERGSEAVMRLYRPASAAIDELVEALYKLLLESSANDPALGPASAKSTCIPKAHE
jgi:hypothetical protein